ncbi:MAG: hypothetical protein ACRCX2_14485, partial [Paraclostridium sp.]
KYSGMECLVLEVGTLHFKGKVLHIEEKYNDKINKGDIIEDLHMDCFEVISKVKEVRVVRKLEDLDGLDNGMGAKIYLTIQGELRVSVGGIKWFDPNVGGVEIEEVLKKLGFKFEYKPLRTIDQVKAEMLSKCKEFKFNGFNYYIKYVQQDKRYYVSYDCFNDILGALYFDKETADKYCNELNEIIGVGK